MAQGHLSSCPSVCVQAYHSNGPLSLTFAACPVLEPTSIAGPILVITHDYAMALSGNDSIETGQYYVINIYNTNDVMENVRNDIYVRPYNSSNGAQVFRATLDSQNHRGFYCQYTGKRMNRNRYENVKCEDSFSTEGSWQAFQIRDHSGAGREILMTVYDESRPLRKVSDSGGYYFTIQKSGEFTTFGFTKYGIQFKSCNIPGCSLIILTG